MLMLDNQQGFTLKIAITILFLLNHVISAPVVYTYVDAENTPDYKYTDLLKIWTHSWQKAGWEPIVLTPEDTKRHLLHTKFVNRMDELDIKHLPRHSYMQNLAMSTTRFGGFYTDIFVFPLHKTMPDDVDEKGNAKLPHDGEMTFHDGVGGSVISGNLAAWDKLNLYLVENIEKNAYFSLQKLSKNDLHYGRSNFAAWDKQNLNLVENIEKNAYFSRQKLSKNDFHYERSNLVENVFGTYNRDVCDKASSKFVIRLHSVDVKAMKVKAMTSPLRNMMIANWLQFYQKLCWEK